jgi:pilus assembly protein Flp/PilA
MALDMIQHVLDFVRSTRGATAIEYGLIAALIAVAAIAAMQGLGTSLNKTFNNVSASMKVK